MMDEVIVAHNAGIEEDREQLLSLMRDSLGEELLGSLGETQKCLDILNQTACPQVVVSHEGAYYAS
jgi:hypothetical protein